jgi:hypothetical protein
MLHLRDAVEQAHGMPAAQCRSCRTNFKHTCHAFLQPFVLSSDMFVLVSHNGMAASAQQQMDINWCHVL